MNCEVLVVGAGPAGCTAANELAKEGIETLVVERDLKFNKPCGGGIPSAGIDEFFFLKDLQNQIGCNVIKRIKICPPLSSPIEVNLEGGEIFIFNRYSFDSFLRKTVQISGINILEGELIKIEQGNKKIKSLIKKKDGSIEEIQSKYLIAADGVNSKVCSILNFEKPEYLWTVSSRISKDVTIRDDTCEFWFGTSHASYFYSWVFPGENYLSVGTGSDRASTLKILIYNFLKKRFPQLEDKEKIIMRAYKIPKWKKRKFYSENVIFCGDALGTVMPITFEGIYYAMKSGQLAAKAIRKGNLGLYEKLWDQRYGRQFRIMKKFQDYMFRDDEKIDKWLNIHRDPSIQKIAMALWLRKEGGKSHIPTYLKAFIHIISNIFNKKALKG